MAGKSIRYIVVNAIEREELDVAMSNALEGTITI
jgi:hypothetical protein